MRRRKTFNPKRRLREAPKTKEEREALVALAEKASYGGNPEHKRNPSDFNLTPPSQPRQAKTLCDDLGLVTRAMALNALKEGFQRGLVSVQERRGWPQNVWMVFQTGHPVEAMLENPEVGTYNGYPLQRDDPFREQVLQRWKTKK